MARVKADKDRVGPKRKSDELTRHEVYLLTQKLESLRGASTPNEQALLDKLRRWK